MKNIYTHGGPNDKPASSGLRETNYKQVKGSFFHARHGVKRTPKPVRGYKAPTMQVNSN